jgi:hypothetical protein
MYDKTRAGSLEHLAARWVSFVNLESDEKNKALCLLHCKLAYLSFHNQHKYCPVVNRTTVDYSAIWRNCNCGGQSLGLAGQGFKPGWWQV